MRTCSRSERKPPLGRKPKRALHTRSPPAERPKRAPNARQTPAEKQKYALNVPIRAPNARRRRGGRSLPLVKRSKPRTPNYGLGFGSSSASLGPDSHHRHELDLQEHEQPVPRVGDAGRSASPPSLKSAARHPPPASQAENSRPRSARSAQCSAAGANCASPTPPNPRHSTVPHQRRNLTRNPA